jgi:hypothetical protein
MLIERIDPFATAKPDARLVKLLIRARQFNATILDSDGVPFAALAKREGVSRNPLWPEFPAATAKSNDPQCAGSPPGSVALNPGRRRRRAEQSGGAV